MSSRHRTDRAQLFEGRTARARKAGRGIPRDWDLTKLKVLADDGPGGKAEERRLRLLHRQIRKDSNLFKAK